MQTETEKKIKKLKPCPFCGGKDLKIIGVVSEDEPKHVFAKAIQCQDCLARGKINFPICWTGTDELAINAWNERPIENQALKDGETKERERIVGIIRKYKWYPETPHTDCYEDNKSANLHIQDELLAKIRED